MNYTNSTVRFKLCLALLFQVIASQIVVGQENIQMLFDSCKVQGSITIYDYNRGIWISNDLEDSKEEKIPASTFKMLNTLILLESGVIDDLSDTIFWPGTIDTIKYGNRPSIAKDITVREAFQKSAGWAYVEMAKNVGSEKYLKILDSCNYGNNQIWDEDTDFWNFGEFGVSSVNQIKLLISIYEEALPFSKKHFSLLKDVMIIEQTESYTLRAKTGWTRYNGINLGWWVGYIETNNNVYFFATRIHQDRAEKTKDFSKCRMDITYSVFRELGILKE